VWRGTVVLLLFTIAICTPPLSFARVLNYRGTITLSPSNAEVSELLTIGFITPANGAERLELNLNKDLAVEALSCARCIGYREGPLNKRTNTRPIVLAFRPKLRPGEKSNIRFKARGKLTDVSSDTNSFSPQWVELSIDSGWYPYEAEDRNFVFDLQVNIDPFYKLIGNGKISGRDGTWRLRRNEPTFDIDLAAARSWNVDRVQMPGLALEIFSVDVPCTVVQAFAQRASSAATTFTEWFGTAAGHDLTIVLNPRQDGSSYSRPGYVSLAFSPKEADLDHLLFNLTHEVAHFWWWAAPGGTWENWLNESFAEYSALMYIRKFEGIDVFNKLMSQRAARSKNQPAIWGVDRKMPTYATVIYAKGAVRLQELEEMLGGGKFSQLLASMARKHIKTTHDFLDELQAESSIEIRLKFEQLLST
jgi:hypothetical protein